MAADTLSLAGKVAIITGSARENGIGAGIAKALARNGAAVTLNYVSESSAVRAENVAREIRDAGGKAIVVGADISIIEDAQKLAQETLKHFGVDHIDILGKQIQNQGQRTLLTDVVNNAGTGAFASSLTVSQEDIQRVFTVNVYGPLYLVQAVVPHMPVGGRIINTSSVASKLGVSNLSVYGASKAALDSLTYTWAEEVNTTPFGSATADIPCSLVDLEASLSIPLLPALLQPILSRPLQQKSCRPSGRDKLQ
jgi:NAD(P)-dependent dehydrogenase (short-subunit alcohol dehydrogenase family)